MSTILSSLTASRNGDREAFGKIIQQYQNTVCAIAYGITGNLQQSEDLTQETFVTAWLQLKDLRDEAKFPSWLCEIARNLAHKPALNGYHCFSDRVGFLKGKQPVCSAI